MTSPAALNADQAKRHIAEVWDGSIVPTLSQYIQIPNKSPAFDPDWKAQRPHGPGGGAGRRAGAATASCRA